MYPVSAFFILVVLLVTYKIFSVIVRRKRNDRKAASLGCEHPPNAPLKGLFGIGTLKESLRATREKRGPIWMHDTLNSIGKTVHTVRASIFDYELIITRDTENVKAMFATQSQDFDIGLHREKCFKSLLGPGVMTNRQESWKHSRGLLRPQFTRDNIADLEIFGKHLRALLKLIPVDARSGWTEEINIAPLFFRFTLDTATEFLLGQSVHSLSPQERARTLPWHKGAPDFANFGHHLDEAKHIIDRRGALAKYGWLIRDNSFPDHCKAVQDCVDYFVRKRLNRGQDDVEKNEKMNGSEEKRAKFILLEELAKDTQDPFELRCQLLNVLHAARDTTASLLGWSFYFLARHPTVFSKLRQEVMNTFSADPKSEITYAQLWSCKYMQFVLNEVVRTVGIVPMNERAAIRDTTLPRGGGPDRQSPIFVPKGTQVLVPTYSMQHREDLWGDDVDEFKPERWQERKFGWDFIPFGGGARQCLGRKFSPTLLDFPPC